MFRIRASVKATAFVIVGQERSGTTLAQTLVSSHPKILCRGELFDVWQIDDSGRKTTDPAALFARDADPEGFLRRKLAGEGLHPPVPPIIGFKLLTQHNPDILMRVIAANPDWKIIHVRRENKLAQFSSRQQVGKTGKWTSLTDAGHGPQINVAPKRALAQCNLLRLEDELLHSYLDRLANPLLTVRYETLYQSQTHHALAAFLGVDPKARLTSPLRKQGQNHILSRFENADDIRAQFEGSGLGHWLDDELG